MKAQEFDCNLLEKGNLTMYAYSALKAYCIIIGKAYSTSKDYEEAWLEAISSITLRKSNIEKPCPQTTFLGLCEDGFLKNVPKIDNNNISPNKQYAIEAIQYLRKNPKENISAIQLWERLYININSDTKKRKCHNQQMHVVLALWNKNLIV